ncbi:FecR family protein [Chitinophaga vietnamensis]|uniref:FecR family protein n=1 Tax=Chitinophaga vietnamensis TaxID=2593957 RepID=UPI001177BD7D|nr:FecR family protein [Chitinophaga vietnamensis]
MNDQQYNRITLLLGKYLEGRCTPEEQRVVDAWYEQLQRTNDDLLKTRPDFAASAAQSLRERLPGLPQNGATVIAFRWKPFLLRASAAAMVIVMAGAWYLSRHHLSHKKTIAWASASTDHELKKILLPDSSVVWLNYASKLEWQTGNDSMRLVKLSGEALFSIRKDAQRPFIVQAEHTSTQVLGTEFNIEAYAGEPQVKVSLLQGKVQVQGENASEAIVLQAGKMATWRRDSKSMEVSSLENEVSAWTKGFTVFNEVPLDMALERLARKNNWQLLWRRKNRPQEPVSALFSKETPAQMVEGIAFTHHLKYTLKDRTLTIY